MVDQVLPPKRDVALKLLEESSLFIHLDPRRGGVSVPPWFKKQPQLVLQVGLHMAVPIPDLEVADRGISCTLSFSRQPHWCFMPWEAIFALVGDDGRGLVWPEDVPPEIARQSDLRGPAPKPGARKRAPAITSLAETEESLEAESRKPASPPQLSVIPGGMAGAASPSVPPPALAPAAEEPAPTVAEPETALAQLALFDGGAASEARQGDAAGGEEAPVAPKRERPAWLRVVKGGADETS